MSPTATMKPKPNLPEPDFTDEPVGDDPGMRRVTLPISDTLLGNLAKTFKLLADPSRLKIVLALTREGPMNVTQLKDLLDQTQPAVSHHLTLMRMVGLVNYDRTGKHNYYYLASEHIRDLFEDFFEATNDPEQCLRFNDFTVTFARCDPS